jgi:peptide/nickel transport system substrate-binding protein
MQQKARGKCTVADGLKPVGDMSRRRLLGTALGVTMVTALGSMVAGKSRAQTPHKGGELRYGVGHGSTTDSLDPGAFANDFTIGLGYMLHNHLAEQNADGDLVGEVAESWEATPDAKTWTFNIRRGIEFHDGSILTPEDVVASINYHRGKDSKSAARPLLTQITDIKTQGNALVINLVAGNADLPTVIADYHLPIMPSKHGNVNAASGIGCGPYVLQSWEPGVRAALTRHRNYWKVGAAHFDRIKMFAIIDQTARTSALVAGQVDLIGRADLKTLAFLKRDPKLSVISVSGNQHYTFPMLTNVAPFDDNNVRMALKLACPRKEMVDKILRGQGSVANDHPIGPAMQFYAADLPQRIYDPEKAKWHLKQAGHGRISVPLSGAEAAFAGAVDAVSLYSERARDAGIDIKIVREPNDGYWTNVWTKKPWCACYWGGRPTANEILSLGYLPGAPWNDTNWKDDRFVKLVLAGRAELNRVKRAAVYRDAQQLLSDDGGTVVPMYANYVFAASTALAHGKIAASMDMDGQKFSERWWFA